jgi:hypothetical protein
MKQVKEIENYLSLEAGVQGNNKWMTGTQDQHLLFSNGGSDLARILQLYLLYEFQSIKFSGSLW